MFFCVFWVLKECNGFRYVTAIKHFTTRGQCLKNTPQAYSVTREFPCISKVNMKRSQRSVAWNHFDLKNYVVHCQHCKVEYTYNSSTTQMMYHLKNVHPTLVSGGASSCQVQPTINEGEGFRQLINLLEPAYHIPSWRTITRLVETRYEERKQELLKELSTAERVAQTTDCWTALTAESYITITCHYISDDWQMNSAVLLTESQPGRHTADHLAEKMNGAGEQWGLDDRVIACFMTTRPILLLPTIPLEWTGFPSPALHTHSSWP